MTKQLSLRVEIMNIGINMNQAVECMVEKRKRIELCVGIREKRPPGTCNRNRPRKQAPPLLQPQSSWLLASSELVMFGRAKTPESLRGMWADSTPQWCLASADGPNNAHDRGGMRNLRLDTGNFRIASGKGTGLRSRLGVCSTEAKPTFRPKIYGLGRGTEESMRTRGRSTREKRNALTDNGGQISMK